MAWTLRRHDEAPLRLTFRAEHRAEALRWQGRLRAKISELIGGLPDEGERRASDPPPMKVLTPRAPASEPWPTVVCLYGHGDKVGDGHNDFAYQAVEHGLAVVAVELAPCEPAAGSALLLGETLLGWRVWDVMRAVDYIETCPEFDARRVGCVGFSGGGTVALFTAALDERIAFTYVSGSFNTFRASIMSVPHCIDNYVPGILNWAELYDVAGLIAPRPLFVESGEDDPIFPAAAAREAFARLKNVYSVLGAEETGARQEILEGGHRFHGSGWDVLVDAL